MCVHGWVCELAGWLVGVDVHVGWASDFVCVCLLVSVFLCDGSLVCKCVWVFVGVCVYVCGRGRGCVFVGVSG